MQRYFLILLLVWGSCQKAWSQDMLGIGLVGVYNSAVRTPGLGFRVQVPVNKVFTMSPSLNYNQGSVISEMNAGLQVQYFLIKSQTQKGYGRYENKRLNPSLYVLAAVNYNKWINYFPSLSTRAKQNNILPMAGLGFAMGGKSLRLFTEAKVNPIWGENMLELGFMMYPFKMGGKGVKQLKCPSNK